jgi:pyrroline-5-carboxylate reductase
MAMVVTFVGGGNMATALIGGMLKQGFAPSEVRAIDVMPDQRARLTKEFGVATFADAAQAAPGSDVIVLAVKPQQLREVCGQLAPHVGEAVVLSIAAGTRLADIGRWLARPRKLVRCMPNTPALIGLGVTASFAPSDVSASERASIDRILGAVGKALWVDREALLDPVTAVSGSGPAYVFYFLEAMQQAATEMGLSAETGRLLAMETFRGAAELAIRSSDPPATLRERVTSKGGTTAAALASMDHDQVKTAIVRALAAANRRAGELADEAGKD